MTSDRRARPPDDAGVRLRASVDRVLDAGGRLLLVRDPDERRSARRLDALARHVAGRAQVARVRCRPTAPALTPLLAAARALGLVSAADQAGATGSRTRRMRALIDSFARVARVQPVLVLLEHLEHADGASCLMLELLAAAWPAGLTVVGSCGDPHPTQPLMPALAELVLEPSVEVIAADGAPTPAAQAAAADDETIFRCEGSHWTLAFGGQQARVRSMSGLRYLAPLLRRPGERVHACELLGTRHDGTVPPERARLAVTKGIKATLDRLWAAHPPLAQHLCATVRCGYFCVYAPDPRYPIRWRE